MKNLEFAHYFSKVLVEQYFKDATLPFPNAYAAASILMIFIENSLGLDDHAHLVDQLESCLTCNNKYGFMIFPDDETIRNHLHDLEELLEMIEGSQGERDLLMIIRDEPGLRLVHSKPVS